MRISNTTIWVLIAMVSAICLYPIQRMIIKNHNAQKAVLRDEILNSTYSFRVNEPNQTHVLNEKLSEISGLSNTTKDSVLLGVQDEDGILFYLNKYTGVLEREVKFAGNEDYEGVEMVNEKAFVVNSKGDIDVVRFEGEHVTTEKIKTFLKRSDDVEGLSYIGDKNVLLVACKSNQEGKKKNRNIYLFDLDSMSLHIEPFISLNPETIAKVLKREKKVPYFSPSAIAIHPETGEIYIISSPAHAIVVFDRNGKLIHGANLDREIHGQPEGMVIDANGTLYISNEARGSVAKLHVFNPVRKN